MSAFAIGTLNRRMRAAVRDEVGSLRGATWTPEPRGAWITLANGCSVHVHRVSEDPGMSCRVTRYDADGREVRS